MTGLGPISHAPSGCRCPFCALVRGEAFDELHSTQADLTDLAVAFVASHGWANNPGHVLVVPVRHVESLHELPDEDGAAVSAVARRVARAMRASYPGCAGVSTRQYNEPAGGQDVWHYHLHVFPRYPGDGLYAEGDRKRPTTAAERRPFADRLRAAMAADDGA